MTARQHVERRENDVRLAVMETALTELKKDHSEHKASSKAAREEIWRQIDGIRNRLPVVPTVLASLFMTGQGAAIGYLAKWVEILLTGR